MIERLAPNHLTENYNVIPLPDSVMICRVRGEAVQCLPVPNGSYLVIPKESRF